MAPRDPPPFAIERFHRSAGHISAHFECVKETKMARLGNSGGIALIWNQSRKDLFCLHVGARNTRSEIVLPRAAGTDARVSRKEG